MITLIFSRRSRCRPSSWGATATKDLST